MEGTGVYWRPVWHGLEGRLTLVLATAMHIRTIPGRKRDKNDATWIADLLALGLIRSRFVPPAPLQDLRELTRTRTQLVREAARRTPRIPKTLEDANIKLTDVISNIRARVGARFSRPSSPEKPIPTAWQTARRDAAKRPGPTSSRRSTAGYTPPSVHAPAASDPDRRPRHRAHRARGADSERPRPFSSRGESADDDAGGSETAAAVIVAEIGDDISAFRRQAISCRGRACARVWTNAPGAAAPHAPDTVHVAEDDPGANRLARGPEEAQRLPGAVSPPQESTRPEEGDRPVAASMLTDVYDMLRDGVEFLDLGDQYFAQRDKTRVTNRLLQRFDGMSVLRP
jgi:hypothetical protein